MGDLKTFNIKQLRDKCKLDTFIETGTLYGDGVQFAKEQGFRQIYSIEIMPNLAQKAQERFANDPNIKIIEGNSPQVLKNLLVENLPNALFWLDSHFPGGDSNERTYEDEKDVNVRTPLEAEIEVIKTSRETHKDVIIIDDLWLYEDGPFEWGSFDEHQKRCKRTITRQQLLHGKDASFIYNAFKETHNIKKFYQHQGYVVMIPKEFSNGL